MDTQVSRSGGDPAMTENAGPSTLSAPPVHATSAVNPPYPPSWVDRLTNWVRRLPLPAWSFYLALGLALTLGYMAILLSSTEAANGTLSVISIVLYSFLNCMTFVYLLGLIHYLDDSAAAALDRFRPVLNVDDAGYNKLRYQLTTLPPWPTWIATVLGAVATFVTLPLDTATSSSQSTAAPSQVVTVLVIGFNVLVYVALAVMVYHTFHQLRTVNAIYTQHTRINLFQLGPLYALSGITARTAIGNGIPTYLWFQANSSLAEGNSVSDIILTVFLGGMIVITFIWPLLGAHSLLEREKQRLADDVARRIETTVDTLHQLADSGKLEDFGSQKGVLDGLVTEQGVIQKLRTWPWRTETVGSIALAFLLPIIIWVTQRVLERFGF